MASAFDNMLDKRAGFLRSSAHMKTTTLRSLDSTSCAHCRLVLLLISVSFACFATQQSAQAVSPPPDGCYPNFTTAEGCNALSLLESGTGNTGIGWGSLESDASGNYNTAIGAGALLLNNADSNTAVGAAALLLNTTGTENTAIGIDTLAFNDSGSFNTANGALALASHTTGDDNTAVGNHALFSDTGGDHNTAVGSHALFFGGGFGNTANGYQALFSGGGFSNTAVGEGALYGNTVGFNNTAHGVDALQLNTTGTGNTAVGLGALQSNTTGSSNIALGLNAGSALTTGSDNIDIGNVGVAAEANTIRIGDPEVQTATFIAGISGTAVTGERVVISSSGQFGVAPSSRRFKQSIQTMGDASDILLALRPVTFEYKPDVDPKGIPQFGLVAEEVEKLNPALVSRDKQGKPYTVRYEAVNAMLLNEFLKEHRKVEQLEKQIEALNAGLQKVNAQLEVSKAAPQTVLND
jgi:trimeric autotransporter adhesin